MWNILEIGLFREGFRYRVIERSMFKSEVKDEESVPLPFIDDNREEIVKTLHDVREKYAAQTARVFLPLHMCLSSIFELPLTKKSDIEGALPFTLEKTLPLPLDEYMYDYSVKGISKSSSKILALSVRRNLLARVQNFIEEAGIVVRSLRCEFMERLSRLPLTGKKSDYIFVDIDSGEMNVAVIKNKTCQALKRIYNEDMLSSEIENLRQLYEINEVIVSGNLTDSIREKVGVTSVMASNRGLFTVPLRSPFIFEFLEAGTGVSAIPFVGAHALLIVGVSLLLLLTGYLLPFYRDYSELKRVDKEIEEIKAKASEPMEKKKYLESNREKLKFLYSREERKRLPLKVINEISNILPKGSWINSLAIDEKGFVELKGFSENASKLVEALDRSETFRNVSFSSPILASGKKSRFSIKMELEK